MCHERQAGEETLPIVFVESMDAGQVALHQTAARQYKTSCAQTHQAHTRLSHLMQVADAVGIDLIEVLQQAADHDHVIKLFGVGPALLHAHLQARAGAHALTDAPHDCPVATQGPALVADVGGVPERVGQTGQ